MKKMVIFCCLLALSGCSKKASSSASPNSAAKSPFNAPSMAATQLQGDPSDVLVEVDGTKLTRGDVDMETEYKVSGAMDQIPPDQLDAARLQVRRSVIEQFVYRTILLSEANRQKITVTKEDEDMAFKEIASQLPPGLTVEAAMKNSPRGEEAMKEEIFTGIKIKRLLDPFMTNTVDVSEQEVTDFMAQYKNNLTMPETVRARHILIATAPNDSEQVKSDKKAKAGEVRQKLADGGDFAKLAEEFSDCPSKARGGDLGPFTRERMVKPFSDAAFSQDMNAVGPVVETPFGYHIIQVTEHSQAGIASREKVTDIVRSQKRQKIMRDYMDELKSKAKVKYSADAVSSPAAVQRPVVSAPFPATSESAADNNP